MLVSILVVAIGLAAFVLSALYGQETYAWVTNQPGLGLLAEQFALITRLKIDPAESHSVALLVNDSMLGMLAVSSALISIALCMRLVMHGLSVLTWCIFASRRWIRNRHARIAHGNQRTAQEGQ
jgi:hypothetical protein